MKLPLPFLEKKGDAEFYLALILQNEKVTSIIFEKIGSAIKYISHDEEEFKNTIEDAESEEFLTVLDKVITSAETSLPSNIETHKTLFGLKENWIEDGKIKKEYLEKLKKASDELVLNPIGFMVFSESIINLIQKEEGAPVTAVLADIGKKYITVSLVKAGKVLETKTSEIHQSPSYTVDTLLKHFQTPEVMPSRVILLAPEEEELTQEFIGHQWSKSLPFLHLPQIMNLQEDASIKAMLLGAATQMGTELLYDSSKALIDDKPEKILPDETIENSTIKEEDDKKEIEEETETPKETLDYIEKDSSQEYFGFVEGADIAKTQTPKILAQKKTLVDNIDENIEEIPEKVKLDEEKKDKLPVLVALVTTKIKSFVEKLPHLLKNVKLNKESLLALSSGNKKILLIPGALVLLLIFILYFYLFSTKAVITLSVNPKIDEKETTITFSSQESTSIEDSIIAAQFVSVEEEGEATIKATGGKEIGEKAKGTVTIFNSDSKSISLPKDTVITSSNNLKFVLDTSVSVASASGDIFSGTKPGTANVNVTASVIGQEYNLPSGTKFTTSNSSVAAKNDNALAGGSKKKVTVVSKDDLNKLLEELPKQLEDKAREDIKAKAEDGKTILSTFVSKDVINEKFSKKEGDEASDVTLTGTVNFEAISYNNSNILSLASSLFDSSDIEISNENLEVSAKNIEIEDNSDVTADLVIKAKLLPKIDKENLLKEIKGSSLQKAKNRLGNISQVTNVEIVLSPNIPFLPKNLPGNTKNIEFKINSN